MYKRFELRGQYHVHKDERQRDCQQEVVSGATEFLRASCQTGGVIARDVELLGKFVQLCKYSGLRASRSYVCQQCHLSPAVKTINCRRACSFLEADNVIQRYPFLGGRS